jgi:hypothetical protein
MMPSLLLLGISFLDLSVETVGYQLTVPRAGLNRSSLPNYDKRARHYSCFPWHRRRCRQPFGQQCQLRHAGHDRLQSSTCPIAHVSCCLLGFSSGPDPPCFSRVALPGNLRDDRVSLERQQCSLSASSNQSQVASALITILPP